MEVMRLEKMNYEKDIVEKCNSDVRLFYRHVNGRMKKRDGITGLKVDGVKYDVPQDMCRVMNETFQTVFIKERDFALSEEDNIGGS